MKKLLVIVLLAIVAQLNAGNGRNPFQGYSYKTYTNYSRNFMIKYPSFLTMGRGSENGDGRSFTANGGAVYVSATSSYFTTDEGSMQNRYWDDLNNRDYYVTYKRPLSSNWYVVSGTKRSNNKVFYKKVYYSNSSNGTQIRTMYLEYPISWTATFDEVIPVMLKSFKDTDREVYN
jgi:hypothetical protein